jgi:predicted alpha/beta-hydrolase family hydrolase
MKGTESSAGAAHLNFLVDRPGKAGWTIALAHGAGAGMNSSFMCAIAAGLAERGFQVVRFEFPYMAERTRTGKKRPPDREPVLRDTWHTVVERLGRAHLVIGGKSMGGRIASLIADEAGVAGLICLGYPFHPVGKPDRLRVEHLRELATPTLILQGTRDPFGNREEVSKYALSASIQVHWLEDGNHDFTPRQASGRSEVQNWDEAIEAIAAFVRKRESRPAKHNERS